MSLAVAALAAATTALILILLSYINWTYKYWQRKNVPSLNPTFPFGNLKENALQRCNLGALYTKIYDEFKSGGAKYGGVYAFLRPVFVPIDPELIKTIMQKDFNHFVDRGMYVNERSDPLSVHLFNITGQRWRNLRVKLTPTFTSGKMKAMFQTLVDCSVGIEPVVERTRAAPIDIKDLVARYTTDVIGSCAFGIDCNSLKNPDAEFRTYGAMVFDSTVYEAIRRFFIFSCPKLMRKLNARVNRVCVVDFFTKIVKDTMAYRQDNGVVRKDFMHLLMQMKDEPDGLDTTQIVAQSFLFFVAGFETSSTTLTFCLYELSVNRDVQDRLRQEVDDVLAKHGGLITYEAMMEARYMDNVINETLRKYPPLPILNRICTEDYTIPGTTTVIERGTHVHIPIQGLQYDPEYYPEPNVFDPNRFDDDTKKNRHAYTHLPFGEGPRVCIGLRFGMMQTKVGLTALLRSYKFTLSDKTKLPLKMQPRSIINTAQGHIWLNATPI